MHSKIPKNLIDGIRPKSYLKAPKIGTSIDIVSNNQKRKVPVSLKMSFASTESILPTGSSQTPQFSEFDYSKFYSNTEELNEDSISVNPKKADGFKVNLHEEVQLDQELGDVIEISQLSDQEVSQESVELPKETEKLAESTQELIKINTILTPQERSDLDNLKNRKTGTTNARRIFF